MLGISLRPVTIRNRGDLDDIDPGPQEKYWVHSNWYWHQQSLDNLNIVFRMVHVEGMEHAVGMLAYGPFYRDNALTDPAPFDYELIHLVIDYRYKRRGIGSTVAVAALAALQANPDWKRVLVASHPENLDAQRFFAKLGFVPTSEVNYDGDPLSVIPRSAA